MKEARRVAWVLGLLSIVISVLLLTQLSEGLLSAAFIAVAGAVILLPASQKPRTQTARAALSWAFVCYSALVAAAFVLHLWLLGPGSFAFLPAALAVGGVFGSILAFRTRRRSSRNYIRSYFTE